MRKKTLKRILDSGDSKKKIIDKLKKRYKYLGSKNHAGKESNQMGYINYHLKKLGAKI